MVSPTYLFYLLVVGTPDNFSRWPSRRNLIGLERSPVALLERLVKTMMKQRGLTFSQKTSESESRISAVRAIEIGENFDPVRRQMV